MKIGRVYFKLLMYMSIGFRKTVYTLTDNMKCILPAYLDLQIHLKSILIAGGVS